MASQANAGPGAARNRAIELAAHDHLLFFDADNVPYPDLVARLWRAMDWSGCDSISAPFISNESALTAAMGLPFATTTSNR